uniref:Amidohydrolase domain containing 2 n=1 Tax=Anolis carolinensis TaxID=28377 RepID=A0A803TU89_ANOCA
MPSDKSTQDPPPVFQFTNCWILKNHQLQREDLWVRGGKILDPEKLFFDEKKPADVQLDCQGCIVAPGFIDVQINGGFGVDFSQATDDVASGISLVAQKILSHGVTSFCPTLVTSPPSVYTKVRRPFTSTSRPQVTNVPLTNGSWLRTGLRQKQVESLTVQSPGRGELLALSPASAYLAVRKQNVSR